MANMSYCRFRNTLEAMIDCEHSMDEDLSPEELRARERMIKLCKKISDTYMDDETGEIHPPDGVTNVERDRY